MRSSRESASRRGARGRGFSLIELLVASAIAAGLVVAVTSLFEISTKIARVQTQVSDLQQASRVGQYDLVRNSRMAARGGLPAIQMPTAAPPYAGKILPAGISVEVQNNVPADTNIGDGNSPEVLEGTDILTVRGVFFSSIYQLDPGNVDLDNNRVTVNYLSPTGVPQDLSSLEDAIDATLGAGGEPPSPEALILVSPVSPNLYAVVEMTGGGVISGSVGGDNIVIQAQLNFATSGGTHSNEYLELSPGGIFPAELSSVAFVGVLEEYRYYVWEGRAIPGDDASELVPRLARARFYPNTNAPHVSDTTSREEIADNILDLQVSLGIDQNNDGFVTEGTDEASRSTDEWLFNSPDDTPDDPAGAPGTWVWNALNRPFFHLRINTLTRSDRPDRTYISPPIAAIEDRVYNEADNPDADDRYDRLFRRRLMQTTVDLRNL